MMNALVFDVVDLNTQTIWIDALDNEILWWEIYKVRVKELRRPTDRL